MVAVLLIKLQEAGFIDYTHFYLVCGCSEYKKAEFDAEIADMEKNLLEWQKKVSKYRQLYPHLNYFTSQQLLDLRKELGKLKQDPNSPASLALKQLLLSVNPNPSQSKIASALSNAVKTMINNTKQENVSSNKSVIAHLNDKRISILHTLHYDYEFKASLIIAAFSKIEDADEDKIRAWCEDNECEFKDEEDIDLSAMASDDESYSINETHPLVQTLILEEKYSPEIAIEAVQSAKQDPQLAREKAYDLFVGRSSSEYKWYSILDGIIMSYTILLIGVLANTLKFN